MPVPITTPVRSASGIRPLKPASSIACRTAATANCEARDMRRASLPGMYWVGSNPLISPAMVQGRPVVSKRVIWSMPERPLSTPSQLSATFKPTGVIAPMPVTTTRGSPR